MKRCIQYRPGLRGHCSVDLCWPLVYLHPPAACSLAWLQEWQVCQVTVGVLGDVCRAIEDQVGAWWQQPAWCFGPLGRLGFFAAL